MHPVKNPKLYGVATINNKRKIEKSVKINKKKEIQYGLDNFMDNNEEDEELEDTNYVRFFLAPKVNDD